MAWNPQINTIDARAFGDNIFDFIKANQSDALKWANGGASLPVIRSFYTSPTLVKVFPSLTILQAETRGTFTGEIIDGVYSVVLETAIQHGKQDILTEISKKYDLAIRSMLANLPETTFAENSYIEISATVDEISSSFDVLGKSSNQFLQVFQTRAEWAIEARAFAE